jgi:hypothetical protein
MADSAAMPGRSGQDGDKVRLLTIGDLDRRTSAYRTAAQLRLELISDMGGAANISAAQRELAGRGALLMVMCDSLEARFLLGEGIALTEYLPVVNTLRRVLSTLGLERRARNVTPDPLVYARERMAGSA